MTDRLYFTDSYLREFTARVTDRSPDAQTLYLDRTAFYPTSGGQPFDLEGGAVDAARVAAAERRANEIVFENRPVTVQFEPSSEARGLRKPSEREGIIRIITIDALDRSACGGTHVRATGEIGAICI